MDDEASVEDGANEVRTFAPLTVIRPVASIFVDDTFGIVEVPTTDSVPEAVMVVAFITVVETPPLNDCNCDHVFAVEVETVE